MVRQVRIRYYAQLREALGKASEEVGLPFPARERDILENLAALHPKQRELFLSSRVAVGDGYVDGQEALDPAGDIDIISPISGG